MEKVLQRFLTTTNKSNNPFLQTKDMAAANIGLPTCRLMCCYETFVHGATEGYLLTCSDENLPHRQAEKYFAARKMIF